MITLQLLLQHRLISSIMSRKTSPMIESNVCQLCIWLDEQDLTCCLPLLATAYLATKSQHSKEGDHKAVLRIIAYIKITINHGIKINCKKLRLHLHCDASWASHHDGSSHTGWILKTLGESYIGSRSSKQRIGSPSSTDAEIISTVDGCLLYTSDAADE